MVFTCSWSDWFIEAADAWRDDAWDVIRTRPALNFQILTKRPENIIDRLPADWGEGWPNVWLGVSAEDQKHADLRIPVLRDVPAAVRFASLEPLLGPVVIPDRSDLDWVIVGGESGPGSRPMKLDWAREIRDQCDAEDIAFFFKQWGAHDEVGSKVGKRKSGCELEGIERKDFPVPRTAGVIDLFGAA
jgi:protein gp37